MINRTILFFIPFVSGQNFYTNTIKKLKIQLFGKKCYYKYDYQLKDMLNCLKKYPDLKFLYNRNTEAIKEKINEKLELPPSSTDKQGFVYGFFSPSDKNLRSNFWMKMGRTTKYDPNERIKEWNGDMIFCQKTSFNKKLERLIHLFFQYANEKRYKNGKTEIEWFHFCEKINILKYTSQINELVDDLFLPDNSYFSKGQHASIKSKHTDQNIQQVVNINKATKSELTQLPNIGNKLAMRIIEYRDNNGLFGEIGSIKNVPYVGKSKYDSISKLITV